MSSPNKDKSAVRGLHFLYTCAMLIDCLFNVKLWLYLLTNCKAVVQLWQVHIEVQRKPSFVLALQASFNYHNDVLA